MPSLNSTQEHPKSFPVLSADDVVPLDKPKSTENDQNCSSSQPDLTPMQSAAHNQSDAQSNPESANVLIQSCDVETPSQEEAVVNALSG